MKLSVRLKLPVLLSVTFCAALVDPNAWFPKLSELGDTVATGVPA